MSTCDVTFGEDDLDRANMKPWWEVAISYGNKLLITACFVAIIVIDSREIETKCNTNPVNSSSAFREDFIDVYCYFQVPTMKRYPGTGMLIGTVVSFITSSWWMGERRVRSAFLAIARTEELLNTHSIIEDDIKKYQSLSGDKRNNIDTAISYMASVKFTDTYLVKIYVAATIFRICSFFGTFGIFHHVLFENAVESMISFDCKINYTGVEEEFYCACDIGTRSFTFAVFFISVAFLMFGFSIRGIYAAISCLRNGRYFRKIAKLMKSPDSDEDPAMMELGNYAFLRKFCVNAPTISLALKELIRQLAEEQMKKDGSSSAASTSKTKVMPIADCETYNS